MAIGTLEFGRPQRITSSGLVAGGAATSGPGNFDANGKPITSETTALAGAIIGFYVSSTSSGTITLYDGQSASGTQITGTITPAVGWAYFPVSYRNGLFVVVGGTIDVTFVVV
jgi:hypothetical protein